MEEVRTPTQDRGHALGGGVLAGLCAGAVMLALQLVANAARGGSAWPVLKEPSLPLFHAPRVAAPTFDLWPVLFGPFFHFVISAAWGGLFGLLFYGRSRLATVLGGLAWGFVVWLAMFYVVLPIFGAFDVTRNTPVGFAIVEHVLFGLVTGVAFLPFQRSIPRRVPPRPARAGVKRGTPVTPPLRGRTARPT